MIRSQAIGFLLCESEHFVTSVCRKKVVFFRSGRPKNFVTFSRIFFLAPSNDAVMNAVHESMVHDAMLYASWISHCGGARTAVPYPGEAESELYSSKKLKGRGVSTVEEEEIKVFASGGSRREGREGGAVNKRAELCSTSLAVVKQLT